MELARRIRRSIAVGEEVRKSMLRHPVVEGSPAGSRRVLKGGKVCQTRPLASVYPILYFNTLLVK